MTTKTTTIKPGDSVWLVKYALTSGVIRDTVRIVSDHDYIFLKDFPHQCFKAGSGVLFSTWAEAVAAMESMRAKKIKSLEKQIAKLRALEWKEPE